MGYNGVEFREPYKMGAASNGLGSSSTLAASMATLSVTTGGGGGDQSTSGSNDAHHLASEPTSSSSSSSLARTNLNPHAAEFVPLAFSTGQAREKVVAASSRLDRTNSSNSNASDDEYRRFCRSQLPDDLMPDFNLGEFVETAEYEEPESLPDRSANWAGSVVQGENQFSSDERLSQSAVRGGATTAYSPGTARFGGAGGSSFSGFVRPYMPELQSSGGQQVKFVSRERQQQQPAWSDSNEASNEWGGGAELSFPENLTPEVVDPIALLAAEFPGFASESLAEIYYANGGDLTLTMDMLTELELQNEGAMAKQFQAPPTPAPPPSSRDFPALTGLENMTGSQQLAVRSSLGEARSMPDFAAAVRKQAAQQAAQLQFERNGVVDFALGGAGRGLSQGAGVGGGFSREARVSHTERLDPFHLHGHEVQGPATWLETGDSVSNMYADMREEARDHARVRNAYFDQARQAYLTGNKALAKELSAKGQWHNEQMKAAHSKAGEAIFYHRNANTYVNNNAAGQPHLIDLHGLHVGEAIPLLKREIAQLRYNARSTRQRASVFICVGTGHHTKGARTPSRLPAAVQRYLLEEEHLQFSEPQAGMLRIIIR